MSLAYACRVIPENYGVIRSEHKDFDLEVLETWVDEHGSTGWFLRDPDSPFDCRYFTPLTFDAMYRFTQQDDAEDLFRRVEKI